LDLPDSSKAKCVLKLELLWLHVPDTPALFTLEVDARYLAVFANGGVDLCHFITDGVHVQSYDFN
jgi:hypothetical protein